MEQSSGGFRYVSVEAIRRAARRRLPKPIRDSVEGAAGRETTLRWNAEALEAVRLLPRAFAEVSARDPAVEVFGRRLALPLVAGPCALAALLHPEGELALARAAAAAGLPFCVSLMSSYALEEIAAVAAGSAAGPPWFELFSCTPEAFTERLLQRAEAAGCEVLVLAAGLSRSGIRYRDLANGFSTANPTAWGQGRSLARLLAFAVRPRWLLGLPRAWPHLTLGNLAEVAPGRGAESVRRRFAFLEEEVMTGRTTWDDVARLRRRWRGRLLVKGILTEGDAARAAELGVDGLLLSNYGGRQLDGTEAAPLALPRIAEALGGRVALFVDGGVRQGSDIVKCLALGATACVVGRPWLWALAADGERGLRNLFAVYARELDNALALLGVPAAGAVGRAQVRLEA